MEIKAQKVTVQASVTEKPINLVIVSQSPEKGFENEEEEEEGEEMKGIE